MANRGRPQVPSHPDDVQFPGWPESRRDDRTGRYFPRAVSSRDVNVALRELPQDVGIGNIREVIHGIIEVGVVVVHPIHEAFDVVHTGKREAAADRIGMLEQGICGMVGAEGGAHCGDRDARRLAIVVDERHHLVTHVSVKLRLHPAAMKRMSTLIVKAREVHGIDAEEFHAPAINQVCEAANQPLVLKLPFVPGAGGKTDERRSPMTVDHDAQLHSKAVRIPAVIFPLHFSPACAARPWSPGLA